jgi:hypothetical protein
MFPDSPGGPQGNVRVGDTFEWSTRFHHEIDIHGNRNHPGAIG